MHTDEPREVQGVELGYDPRDIDLGRILKIVVYFFVFALVFFGGGAIYYVYIGKIETSQRFDARKPAIVGPKLQGDVAAKTDIMAMRQVERKEMTTYRQNADGSWRIPVDRAMALLTERGLPAVKSDQAAVSPGNTIPQNATGMAPRDDQAGKTAAHGPSPSFTTTSPANPGPVPTPDAGGATGSTVGATGP